MNKNYFSCHFAAWLIVTVLCGLIYAAVQQSHRATADDPQFQIAQDIKIALEAGHPVDKWMTADTVNIEQSLSTFITLYDKNMAPVLSTGFFFHEFPRIPNGAFAYTRNHGDHNFTWQPQYGTRIATVMETVASPSVAFVVVGRSLKEVEKRESTLRTMVIVAWLVCAGIIVLHFVISSLNHKNQNK